MPREVLIVIIYHRKIVPVVGTEGSFSIQGGVADQFHGEEPVFPDHPRDRVLIASVFKGLPCPFYFAETVLKPFCISQQHGFL